MDAREKIGELLSALGADAAKSSHWAKEIIHAGVCGWMRQDAAEEAWHPEHAADVSKFAAAAQVVADFQFGPTGLSALFAASGRRPAGVIEVQEQVRRLADDARVAAELLAENSRPLQRGRKPKAAAAEITRVARLAFEDVTGTRAGRSIRADGPGGRYWEFLRAVFAAMGVDASADAQARTYGKK